MNKQQTVQSRVHHRFLFVCLVCCVVATILLNAADAPLQLPPETARFKQAPGYELPSAICVICHSPDYIATQPRLPRSFWTAEVQKMQKTYGAPILDSQVQPLVDYLVKNYGIETPGK